MATLSKHVLGVPKGSLADSITFTSWKGKACIRSLATSVNDRNTEEQQAVRNKFRLLGATLVPLSNVINIGWNAYDQSGRKAMTAQNAYMKYHLTQVDASELFNGDAPDFESINADKLIVARGSLTGPTGATYVNGRVALTFPDDVDTTQVAYAVLYNPTTQKAVSGSAEVTGTSVNIDGLLPGESWSSDTYLYYFVTNAEGTKASTSECYGTI